MTKPITEGKLNSKFNDEPVEFCSNCGSLHLIIVDEDTVCQDCNSINYTEIAPIYKWIDDNKTKNLQ